MYSKLLTCAVAAACCLASTTTTFASPSPSAALMPLTQYVNPFVGTAPGTDKFGFSGDSGDVFPGALWPRGMVQFSPDTPSDLPGGYNYPDTSIKGFSLTHFSGRGCDVYQDLPFMPVEGSIAGSPTVKPYPYIATFSHASEAARPGYYSVRLDNGIEVELTATEHIGFARFTFPNGPAGTILLNATGSVNGNGSPTNFAITGDREVSGMVTSRIGCGSEQYTLYFVTEFDHGFQSFGVWSGSAVTPSATTISGGQSGAYLGFDTTQNTVIMAKTGISYVSIANARENLLDENPGWDFTGTSQACDAAWNKVLNRIQVHGGTVVDNRTFYTALYHSFIHPNVFSDVNGQYIGFDGQVHTLPAGHKQYENISGWDLYRSLIPLQALLVPQETADVAQSMVDDAEQGGGALPRWEQTNHTGGNMCGDSQLILLTTAYAYGATGFDTVAALKAMKLDASDPNAECDGHHPREGIVHYIAQGYIPGASYDSASPTLEYSSDDFALSQFAKAVGDDQTAAFYLKEAQNWKNLFNPAIGYINPRNDDGSWRPNYDPGSGAGFVEGSGGQYTWMTPFNLAALFAGMGGDAAAVTRLDTFFTKLNDGPDQYAFMGNEPSEEVPWEYDWAGKPSGAQEVVRRIQNQLFNDQPNGFPGNDDGGAISSWYVWSAIGLYPEIPGVAGYAVGSPRFSSITIRPDGRKAIRIDAANASPTTPYVNTLTLNGVAYDSPWIPFNLLSNGCRLVFDLRNTATEWGASPANAPPSFDASPNVMAPSS